jgi:hypothetical protein
MSQTVYNTEHTNGLEGAAVDDALRRVTSFLAEGAVTPGYAVTLGTDADTQRKLVVDGASTFEGVALQHSGVVIDDSTSLAAYKDKEGMSVLEKGRIWVHVDAAVAVGDTAYVQATGVDKGRFTKTPTGNIATGGKFIKSTAGAGLTILEL